MSSSLCWLHLKYKGSIQEAGLLMPDREMNSICLPRRLCPGNRERSHYQWKLYPAEEKRTLLSEQVNKARRGSKWMSVYSMERAPVLCQVCYPFDLCSPTSPDHLSWRQFRTNAELARVHFYPALMSPKLWVHQRPRPRRSTLRISALAHKVYLTIGQQHRLLHIKCLFLELRICLRLLLSHTHLLYFLHTSAARIY